MTVSIVGTMTGVRPRARGGGGGGGSGTTTGTRTADTGLSIVELMTLTTITDNNGSRLLAKHNLQFNLCPF